MANALGPVTLPDGTTDEGVLIWVDQHDWTPVAQVRRRTLAGTLVVAETPLSGGRPITLEATPDSGWLTQATVDALEALARAGGIWTLTFDGYQANVTFRYQDGPLAFHPIAPKWDRYVGFIRLQEV